MKQQHDSQSTSFNIRGEEIELVSSFEYLGRQLTETDDDVTAIHTNIAKARTQWGKVVRILARQTSNRKTMGKFFETVVESVLLYGSETWVLSNQMMALLDSFHHRCARFIPQEHIQQLEDGSWITPSNESILKKAGLKPIKTYIQKRKEKLYTK